MGFIIDVGTIALLASGLILLTKGIKEKKDPLLRKKWFRCAAIALAGWLGVNVIGLVSALL